MIGEINLARAKVQASECCSDILPDSSWALEEATYIGTHVLSRKLSIFTEIKIKLIINSSPICFLIVILGGGKFLEMGQSHWSDFIHTVDS